MDEASVPGELVIRQIPKKDKPNISIQNKNARFKSQVEVFMPHHEASNVFPDFLHLDYTPLYKDSNDKVTLAEVPPDSGYGSTIRSTGNWILKLAPNTSTNCDQAWSPYRVWLLQGSVDLKLGIEIEKLRAGTSLIIKKNEKFVFKNTDKETSYVWLIEYSRKTGQKREISDSSPIRGIKKFNNYDDKSDEIDELIRISFPSRSNSLILTDKPAHWVVRFIQLFKNRKYPTIQNKEKPTAPPELKLTTRLAKKMF